MFKEIELTQGKKVLVDEDLFEELNKDSWYFDGNYAVRNKRLKSGKRVSVRMHSLIIGAGPDEMVDHISGDTLDNRRSNLRIVTRRENNMNARKRAIASSKYKGVYFFKRKVDVFGKWKAKIQTDYEAVDLGYFNSEIDAALAYNEAAKKYFGDYAVFNEVELINFHQYQKRSNRLRKGQWFRTGVAEFSTELTKESEALGRILKESLPSGDGLDIEEVTESMGEILNNLSNLASVLKIDLNEVAVKSIELEED